MELEKQIEALRQFSTIEICDGMTEFRVLDPAIRRMTTDKKIVGPAFPVEIPAGVSGILPDAVMQAKPGQVMVVAAQGFCRQSCWGDYRSLCAAMRKLEGVVIDGAFRDLEGCEAVGLPIFARCVVPQAGGKEQIGEINVPVCLDGVTICPGDLVMGDADGVIVIPPHEVEAVMERAREKIAREEAAVRYMKEMGEVLPRANLFRR